MNYEKVSVNIDDKKLSQMDLLIENGFYANRSDFINQALDAKLDEEADCIAGILERQSTDALIINDSYWFIGLQSLDRAFLERVRELGKKIRIKGFGVLYIGSDCEPELVAETVEAVSKKIRVNATDEVKKLLAER